MLNLNILREYLVLFIIGGITYVLIEISYRGYSHISMFIVGGFCFILVSSLNEFPFEMPLVSTNAYFLFVNNRDRINIWCNSKYIFSYECLGLFSRKV